MPIVDRIRIFNQAFSIALNMAVDEGNSTIGLGANLSNAIRSLMKDGMTYPTEIGNAAYKSVNG